MSLTNSFEYNGCEIALRPYQFCNLCEVNASDVSSQADLNERARAAALIGTLQAGYTDFHYLRQEWKQTTEKEALIGVGMTGIGSGAVLKYNLVEAANVVVKENVRIAELIGINSAARTTTIKPSGTSSLVCGSASGIHAWHNDYYIRRMRLGKDEALYTYLKENIPNLVEDDVFNPNGAVASFPQKAPEGSILRHESPAQLLERVRMFNINWVRAGHVSGDNTHNVSCTISVKDNEWSEVADWMWNNRNDYNGISVLPYNGGTYQQAPFEDITEEQFLELEKFLKSIDLTQVYEAESGAGEPGVYWSSNTDWGTNPCCEIALRPYQFCNLCEVNASDVSSQADLNERARAAALIGTLQAGYTDFHYLRQEWKQTTEKEALIGVGMTGIGSGAVLKYNLVEAANVVVKENVRIAELIGINSAARTTTIKPSGTSSLVCGSASGIHAWHNDYYIRRMRLGKDEALYTYLKENIPNLVEDDVFNPNGAVASFPQKAPEGSILRHESPAQLLERVRMFNINWVRAGHVSGDNTHNVSCTISVKDNEWSEVADWMWNNRNDYNGISVLPYNGGTYQQAPFEDITEEQFLELEKFLKSIDLTQVYEAENNTDLTGEVACGGNGCEVL